MHEVGQQWKEKENKIRQRRVKKERQKISRFYKECTQVQKGLMYKTKGVESNPRVEMNKVQATLSRFLLNITLKHSLSLSDPFFHSPLTTDHITSPIKPMWIKEWLILLLSWNSGMEPGENFWSTPNFSCDSWKKKRENPQGSALAHLRKKIVRPRARGKYPKTIVIEGYIWC